jgi:predicted permease
MRFYQALLHLYPASFRNEYAVEMSEVFRQRVLDASGPLALIALWLDTLFDIFTNAARVHLDIFAQDLRYSARALRSSPGFTVTAIVVAALGIGASTSAFSITDHVLLRPLPFADADRLVHLWEDESPQGYSALEPSPANYRDWKRMSKSFESMGAYASYEANLSDSGEPRNVTGAGVTSEILPMLGVQPFLGRLFSRDDERESAPGTVLLSYELWKSQFGGDPSVLGRRVVLDNQPRTIIGVMPADFFFPHRDVQLWIAMRFAPIDFVDRSNNYLYAMAKLRPGVSMAQARAEMRLIGAQLRRQYPKENQGVKVAVTDLRDQDISARTRMLLKALLGAALCVLLIACINLANLLLARALVRRKELAVRTAMGAGRERLVRQLLTESLILAIAGGALGILIAIAVAPLLVKLVPQFLPISAEPAFDLRLLGSAALLTCLTGIAFGVFPALRACNGASVSGLQEGSRGGLGGRRERLRAALVIGEVTGSVVLLISAGLLIRALWRVQSIDPGFRTAGVLTLRTSLPMPKYEKTARRNAFYNRVLPRVRALPGVESAGYVSFLPMVLRGGVLPYTVEGHPFAPSEFRNAYIRFVTPGFFETLSIPLLDGRDASESDRFDRPWVCIVSQSFVKKYWPHERPLGHRIHFAAYERIIVGVAGDVKGRGLEREAEPQIYIPYQQDPDNGWTWYAPKDLAVRASGNPMALMPAIRRIIHDADPEQPISSVQMLSQVIADDSAPRAVQVRVLGAFALVALLLAGIGIHGLLSFAVSQRKQEIGVRIAVGARPADILRLIMSEGVALAMAGIALGAAAAYAAARTMESLLAGVKPDDPRTFLAAIAVVLAMTVAGSLAPAIRAVLVDPIAAIRAE